MYPWYIGAMKNGIHPWPLEEITALCELSIATFVETFADQNAEDDMASYVASQLSYEKLKAELQDCAASIYGYYLAGQAVGYVKINRSQAQTEQVSFDGLEVERLYVLKTQKGNGIGKELMMHAESVARGEGIDWIWLGVWEHNVAAISFYLRGGFTPFGSHVFQLGSDAQTDILYRKNLA